MRIALNEDPELGELVDLDAARVVDVGLLEEIEQLGRVVVVRMLVPAACNANNPACSSVVHTVLEAKVLTQRSLVE